MLFVKDTMHIVIENHHIFCATFLGFVQSWKQRRVHAQWISGGNGRVYQIGLLRISAETFVFSTRQVVRTRF